MTGYWQKSKMAASASHLLFEAGDPNGAVNRAYFAMFYAARAALERVSPEHAAVKRHASVIGRFAQHVIRQRGLDPALGRAFNIAFDHRLVADYEREGVDLADAREIVDDMTRFLRDLAPVAGEQPS